MSNESMRLPTKPFFDYTEAERQQLFKLIETCVNQGTKVMLGQTRCFFCGTEMDETVERKQVGMGTPFVMVNLCHDCWIKPEVQTYLKKSSQQLGQTT